MTTTRTNKRTAALGLTLGLAGGAAAGFAFGVPGLSSAASDSPAVAIQQDDGTTDTTETTDERPEAGERLREALQPLVDDGTITTDQADAVASHLAEQRPEGRRGGHRGHGGHHLRDINDAVTELLGMDGEAIREALRGGQTLAELAEAAGVDPQAIVDVMVGEAAERLDEAVANGRLTQGEADERLAELTDKIAQRVEEGRPERPADAPDADG